MSKKQQRQLTANDIDATTFQSQLEKLAITMTHKVEREGIEVLGSPNYAVTDIGVILRQAVYTYDLLYYINSDEIRTHSGWRQGYTFAALPLVRSLIDCLYNITAILDKPAQNARFFRVSGYNRLLLTLDDDEKMYGGDPKWDAYIQDQRHLLSLDLRSVGFNEAQIRSEATLWPTLSTYIRTQKGKVPTKHQLFLKSLTFGFWAEYSAVSHATFQGLKLTAPYFLRDRTAQDQRDALLEHGELVMSQHLFRAAGILLSIITELQIYFQFDGASIVERMNELWKVLVRVFEIKELYEQRYKKVLEDAGMLSP